METEAVLPTVPHCYLEEDRNKYREHLLLDLCRRCHMSSRTSRLPPSLMHALLNLLSAEERREMVGTLYQGAAPLFHAAAAGNAWLVELLVLQMGADVEQKGTYTSGGLAGHRSPPLWVASLRGHLDVVRLLVQFGATVDALSDSGSSALRSACFQSRQEVVAFLLEKGASHSLSNSSGGTSLMNAVQSPELVRLLLRYGVDIHAQDMCGKSALHYAVEGGYRESVSLLVGAGASLRAIDQNGDDALRVACLTGQVETAEFLLSQRHADLSPSDVYRLLGCSVLSWDTELCRSLWSRADRPEDNCPKGMELLDDREGLFADVKEWSLSSEVDLMDVDCCQRQALAVLHRLLGGFHPNVFQKMNEFGTRWIRQMAWSEGLVLLNEVFYRRMQTKGLLSHVTVNALNVAVGRYLCCGTSLDRVRGQLHLLERLLSRLLTETLGLAFEPSGHAPGGMPSGHAARPFGHLTRTEAGLLEEVLNGILELTDVLLESSPRPPPTSITSLLGTLVRLNPRGSMEQSLLHLATCSTRSAEHPYNRDPHINTRSFCKDVFPSARVARLLLELGADPNAFNRWGSTPLHLVTDYRTFNKQAAEVLLAYGAHADVMDLARSPSPLRRLADSDAVRIRPLHFVTLQCMAARVIRDNWETFKDTVMDPKVVPAGLRAFVNRH